MLPSAPARPTAADAEAADAAGAVTLVLSREVRAGHEQAFEDVLRRLSALVRRQPGHLDVTILRPPPGGPRIYTIVSHFAAQADADARLSSETRARLGRRGRAARIQRAADPIPVRP